MIINGNEYELHNLDDASVLLDNQVETVYVLPMGLKKCPICAATTLPYELKVPIYSTSYLITTGRYCGNCKAFFSVSAGFFKEIENLRISYEQER